VPQFLFGYVIYRRVTNRVGYRPVIIGSMAATLVAVLLICYVDNPYLFIVANLLIGLAYSQVFYAFLSMAIV
jgi:MFS family permease